MTNKIDINKVFMGLENGSLVLELDLSDFDSQEDLEEYLQEFLNININYLFCIEDKSRVYPQCSSIEEIWERYEILNELDGELIYQYDKNINSINTLSNDALSDIKDYSFYKISPKEYTRNLIEDIRSWNGVEIPEKLLPYLDYEEIADNLLKGGDIVETNDGILVLDYCNN